MSRWGQSIKQRSASMRVMFISLYQFEVQFGWLILLYKEGIRSPVQYLQIRAASY